MDGIADMTTTSCGACGLVSEVNERMVCCDNCDVWYHYRCVGVTAAVESQEKWYCPEEDCQNQKKLDEETSKTGTKKKTAEDISDKSSLRSDGKSGSSLERELRALEKERKKKELEMSNERVLWEKRMEMNRILQEQRIKMENELRAKELQQEEQLLQKALLEKQTHLDRMKKLRESYHDKMNQIEQDLSKLKSSGLQTASSGEGTSKNVKTPNTGIPLENAHVHNQKESDNRNKHKPEDERDESEEASSEDESDGSSDGSNDDTISSESGHEEVKEEKQSKKKRKNPEQRQAPSKVQLAARSGISKKLPVFTGKPEEWPLFIGTYQASTDACGFNDVENLVRLQESLKGPALESVRGQLLFPKSVPRVISKLRQLYGRPEQLLQCHLEKVRRLEAPKPDKLATYVPFGNTVEQLCEHLEAAKLKQHLTNPLLIQDLVDKLPAHDKREWVRFKNQQKRVNLRTFTDFVSTIVAEACEANVKMDFQQPAAHEYAGKGKIKEKGVHVYNHSAVERSSVGADEIYPKPCRVCKRTDHRLRFCQDFRALALADRLKLVEQGKLCVICLNDHGNAPCKFKIRCNIDDCRERHNPLLHPVTVAINAHFRCTSTILFRMLPVTLHCGKRSVNTLAFLDEGASVTLIEKSLAEVMGAEGPKEKLTIKWTADITRVEKESRRVNLLISGSGSSEKYQLSSVRTVDELLLPKQTIDATGISRRMKHLRGLPIASYENQRPGLLIGLNNLHVIAPMEAKIGELGDMIAVRSKLGWAVYGPNQMQPSDSEVYLGHHDAVSNQDLHDLLKVQYALEDSVIVKLPESDEDRRARLILEKTTRRVGNRFETGLLWDKEDAELPNSYPMAVRRMKCLEQRLLKQPALFENVCSQIEQYQQKGYAHPATAEELAETEPGKVWYLPLNVVVNPRKPGKVRLVWDAAASVNGTSLNSLLLTGPDLLVSILTVFCKFRERPIAFGGDIREMYHQMLIRRADKRVQRFIFRHDPRDEPCIYVMDVATFGAKCSPCSAQFVKNMNAMEFVVENPEAVAAIVEKHYVDDYFDSVDTIEEAIQRAKQVRLIHAKGGFEIRNWVSNSEKVLSSLGESKEVQTIHFNQDKETGNERVLGIIWNTVQDVFSFSTEHREDLQEYLRGSKKPTKRIVLSCVMGFFDPLGLLSCFTVHGKILVQDLWRNGCEWDQEIDDECLVKWQQWIELLPLVEQIRIPRSYFGRTRSSEIDKLELHIFTDASIHTYGCVAYFRASIGDEVKCSLAMSRSKVAPLKMQSIPRLELMGAVLGARMWQTIKAHHSLPINRCFLWTDSQTVMSWLRSDQRKYKQFVAFRVGEILETTGSSDWRWIPSRLNLADALTKWGQGPPLSSDGEWFKGARFLYEPEESWPNERLPVTNIEEEMKMHFLHHETKEFPEPIINVEVTWRWIKLLRIIACVIRFITNIRRKVKGLPIRTLMSNKHQQRKLHVNLNTVQQPLQQDEFMKAEVILWKQAQLEVFPNEVVILLGNETIKGDQKPAQIGKRSPLYKLTPILDEFGVIRMNGRMAKSKEIPFDMKFPIILPKGHAVTKRLIQYYHEKFGHANRETVLNELRQKFHIPKMRMEIQRVMKDCIWCKVNRCYAEVPMMAPLPIQRITQPTRPFSAVGVDYLGPVEVTVGRRREKRWIALFTCLAVRAVHLDVVHTLTTQACLMAIRRFICKRGVPDEIFSDNGTNFKGASKELILWMKRVNYECADSVVNSSIKWNFNPPGTPHMGGIWERMVRSVKEAMKALDDGRRLTDEILLTTLAEAEDMVNSRPLTYVSQESASETITPNHFLRGTTKSVDRHVDGSVDFAEALRDTYKRSQYLADQMWQRWYKEYLPTINKRTKWFSERRSLKKGDLVFVVDGQHRKSWIRGIVEETIIGSDGRVRQADVRTSNGLFRRGVANLAVLEIGGKSGQR
ncbi:uncharacterized protein LOC129774475 [Toxorhynchites rutilus septentrionalis]|uniref:uncharacterized protein LOC129774475 n=1 Tax=Toxorhynchites rutilus septentrionalis TaxID=329112 RepID=UPI00247A7929|nr:uncharacterized protein LOC129774475 [Toxorhynchites rutilus septentrionalis]